jgi:hypothetical protein
MVLVKHILEAAQKRLAVLGREASLYDVARILASWCATATVSPLV